MLRFRRAGASHVGLVRPGNEDSGFAGSTLLLVADGVGGAAGGEVASATAAYVVAAEALARVGLRPAGVLEQALADAHRQLALGELASPDLAGMATTLTAVLTDGQRFALAHIGDSRGYVLRPDPTSEAGAELTRVTTDHTWVQQMQSEGRLAPEEVAHHPWRNVVLRSLNGESELPADVVPLALREGDRVLLASDGLTDLVPESRIERILVRTAQLGGDDEDAADALIEAALRAGGHDNVTAVIGTVTEGPRLGGDGLLLGALGDPRNVIDPAAVRADATA